MTPFHDHFSYLWEMVRSWRICLVSALIFTVVSCSKDGRTEGSLGPVPPAQPPVNDTTPHTLQFDFSAYANNEPMVAGSRKYTNLIGDTLTVTKFTYYASLLKFYANDGKVWSEPGSYHLIRHVEGDVTFTVTNLPAATYTAMSVVIGVDSIRNVSGAQSGALDPAYGMFWDWNSGYIFFKLEGYYRSQLMDPPGQYAIHIGGFKAGENCIRESKIVFPQPAVCKPGKVSRVHVRADVDEIFMNPTLLGFDDYFIAVSNGPRIFQTVADNYKDMFRVTSVEN